MMRNGLVMDILKVELRGFADGFNTRFEPNREAKVNTKLFRLRTREMETPLMRWKKLQRNSTID